MMGPGNIRINKGTGKHVFESDIARGMFASATRSNFGLGGRIRAVFKSRKSSRSLAAAELEGNGWMVADESVTV
jgi:hypothetical protein